MTNFSIIQQLAESFRSVYENWPALVLFLFLGRLTYTTQVHPLSKIPGPTMARVSRWWLLWVTLEGRQRLRYVEAHQKYGAIVRVKPNTVIINDAEFLQANFFEWDKSDWWLAFRTVPRPHPAQQ